MAMDWAVPQMSMAFFMYETLLKLGKQADHAIDIVGMVRPSRNPSRAAARFPSPVSSSRRVLASPIRTRMNRRKSL